MRALSNTCTSRVIVLVAIFALGRRVCACDRAVVAGKYLSERVSWKTRNTAGAIDLASERASPPPPPQRIYTTTTMTTTTKLSIDADCRSNALDTFSPTPPPPLPPLDLSVVIPTRGVAATASRQTRHGPALGTRTTTGPFVRRPGRVSGSTDRAQLLN